MWSWRYDLSALEPREHGLELMLACRLGSAVRVTSETCSRGMGGISFGLVQYLKSHQFIVAGRSGERGIGRSKVGCGGAVGFASTFAESPLQSPNKDTALLLRNVDIVHL